MKTTSERGAYLRCRWPAGTLLLGCLGIFTLIGWLYDMPGAALGYAWLLSLALTAAAGGWDFLCWRGRRRTLQALRGQITVSLDGLPEPWPGTEEDYQELLAILRRQCRALSAESAESRQNMVDYYTLWAHQIKTPIAAMKLLCQEDDSGRGREMTAELLRVEQYVEMVLHYLRLESESTDYVIRETEIDPLLRQAARRYAPLFIRSRVALQLEETGLCVLTDGKWLGFVVEQLLSNAVKYAPGGTVRIYAEGETLCIADNGIGIAPEDLPRVFERGYTGKNGRLERRSTGIGLFLCREVCRRLGHGITVASRPGEGAEVRLDLHREKLEAE